MSDGLARAGMGNWRNRLLLAVALLAAVLLTLWLMGNGGGGEEGATAANAPAAGGGFLPETVETAFTGTAPVARAAPEDQTLALIEEHERKLANDPGSPDTPALLMATGNLYRARLKDCARAVYYYRTLITEFPESPNLGQAYVQLCDCYTELGDLRALRLMCREMLDHFPPESQEYQYARSVLDE